MKRTPFSPARAALAVSLFLASCGSKADLVDGALSDAPDGGLPRADDMFDDFEDGNLDVNPAGGRFGHWYNYGDDTDGMNAIGVVTLDPSTARHTTYKQTSKMALRVSASGYSNWGSGFSADIAASSPYDITAYTGLIFWTKNHAATPASVKVAIQDVNSDPRGGRCDKTPGAPKETACYDTFGKQVTFWPGDWELHLLPFWSLEQMGFGLKADALATHEVYSVVFVDSMGSSYDYDIDDIGFYIE